MIKQYFTMSRNQIEQHWPYLSLSGGYVEVNALDADDARRKMIGVFGKTWAFQYDSIEEIHPLDRRYLATIEE